MSVESRIAQRESKTETQKMLENEKAKANLLQAADIATDFIPGVSETKDIISLGQNIGKGQYLAAGADAVALGLGAVPVVGDIARRAFKTFIKKDIAEAKKLLKDDKLIDKWKDDNPNPKPQKRNPDIQKAANDLLDGKITGKQYRSIVKENMPIKKINEVPKIPTFTEIVGSLTSNKSKKGILGLNKEIKDGTRVASRLDIPAYEKHDTWIVSVHNAKNKKGVEALDGDIIGYGKTAVLKNVEFKSFPAGAAKISAHREDKGTIARIFGNYVNAEPEEVAASAKKFLNDPEWTQIGYNPFRHGFFYNKSTGMPIKSAQEVIQVGPLVLAKNAKKFSISEAKQVGPKGGLRIREKGKTKVVFNQGGNVMNEDVMVAEKPKYDFSDENLVNLPPQILENFLAKKYGVDAYMRERSSVFEDSSRGEITDRESILTGPELEALSINFENQIKKAKGMKKGGMPQQMELFLNSGADVSKETKEKRNIQYINAESKKTKKELDDIAKNIKSEQSTEDSFKDSMKKLEGQKKEISEFSKMKKKDFANMTIDELIELKKRMQDLRVRSNFSEGGLKDEGNTVDPVSGNDVPPGATQEEVRDDIPAQLSEGEFVFPADVVRYIGLEKLMMMRQEAKAGLKRMEEMGQMGNSEEATLPDDMPFDITDLDMRDETEEDVLKANVGAFVPPRFPTNQPYNPNVNPYMPMGTVPAPYMPYNPAGAQQILEPVGGGTGQAQTEMRRYVNKETGQVRMIPFNKATGTSLFPIDSLLQQGFVREDEAPKAEAPKTTKIQTTKVKPVEQDSGDDGGPSPSGAVDATGVELNKSAIKSTSLVGFLDTVKPLAQFRDTFKGPAYALFESKVQGVSPRTTSLLSSSIGGVLDNFRGGDVSITAKGTLSGNYGNTTPLHELTKEQQDRLGIVGARVVSVIQPLVQTLNEKTGKYENTLTLQEQIDRIEKKAEELKIATTIREKGSNIISKKRPETIIREIAAKEAEKFQTKITNLEKVMRQQDIEAKKDPDRADDEGYDYSSPTMSDFGTAAEQYEEGFEPVAKGGLLKKKPKVKRMKKGGLASKK